MIRNEDTGLDLMSKNLSKEQLLGPITDSVAYEIDVKSLQCTELENNMIFKKLKQIILKFFITREENRRYGQN